MNARTKTIRQLAIIMLFVFVTLSSAAAPGWTGTISEEDGWPLVNNPSKPLESDQTIVAQEIWRLGHDEDEQETIFGLISDGLVDKDETTYLLDSHLTTIYKVGPDGEVLDNIGREGDGPGEFRNILDMVFMPNGTLGIFEMMPGRIVTMGRDGQPEPLFDFGEDNSGGMKNISRMATDKNSVVIGLSMMQFGEDGMSTTNSLARYDMDGAVINTLFSDTEDQTGGSVTIGGEDGDFTRFWALDNEGRVVAFYDKEQYKLNVFGTDGKPAMMIRREYTPIHRSAKDIKADERQQKELRKRFVDMESHPVPKIARHISDVFSRPNGDIWVQNSQGDRDCPVNSIGYFDVFNKDGQYVKRVRIEADYDPERDNFRILDHHLLVFKEAQKAPERTTTSGGGSMQMIMVSGVSASDDEDEDEEPRPYEVVFYRLP